MKSLLKKSVIFYTDDEKKASEFGLKKFEYFWFYYGKKKVDGEKAIYCQSVQDFVKLLDCWNSGNKLWKYAEKNQLF